MDWDKKKIVRSNTVRNYTERYIKNIKPVIGEMPLSDVKPLHCQKIFYDMADQEYRTSTIYQARIALYNMFEYAKENEVLCSNPCKKSVKSDMGKPSEKKVALTRDIQKTFLQYAEGQSYENQYRFILQTGLRTGELVGLKWKDVDLKSKTIQIRRSMEYRYSAKKWRIGEPKSKSGYRTIPLTEEAVANTKKTKKKRIRGFQKFQQNGKNLCFCVEKERLSRTVHMIQRCLKSVIKQKFQDFRCIS